MSRTEAYLLGLWSRAICIACNLFGSLYCIMQLRIRFDRSALPGWSGAGCVGLAGLAICAAVVCHVWSSLSASTRQDRPRLFYPFLLPQVFSLFLVLLLPSKKCTRSSATQLSLFNEPINL
jgi:hypothetical protein